MLLIIHNWQKDLLRTCTYCTYTVHTDGGTGVHTYVNVHVCHASSGDSSETGMKCHVWGKMGRDYTPFWSLVYVRVWCVHGRTIRKSSQLCVLLCTDDLCMCWLFLCFFSLYDLFFCCFMIFSGVMTNAIAMRVEFVLLKGTRYEG